MRKPQPKTLPVMEIPLGKNDDELVLTVLFDRTRGAHFLLYRVPESGGQGDLLLKVDDSERLHSHFLSSIHVGPGAQFAVLVHQICGPDYEPEGSVTINLAGPDSGQLEKGHI